MKQEFDYTIDLYRAIVSSGARQLKVSWDIDNLWLDFDGTGLSVESNPLLKRGIRGALSLQPEFLKIRTPKGSWEYRGPAIAALGDTGPNQIHIRRRQGKTVLWRLGRHLLPERRELRTLRKRCSSTDIALTLKDKLYQAPLQVERSWEVRIEGAPALHLSESARSLSPAPAPPFPLHAVFWPAGGEARLRHFLDGAEVAGQKLPWGDLNVALSSHEERVPIEWIGRCREVLLTSGKPEWRPAATAELLKGDSPMTSQLAELPLFAGRSLARLRSSALQIGEIGDKVEPKLAGLGVRFLNSDLNRMMEQWPNTRGELLLRLWQRHNITWAIPNAAAHLPGMGEFRAQAGLFPSSLRIPEAHWLWEDDRTPRRARLLLRELQGFDDVPKPELFQLAYLELALLTEDPVKTLATSAHPAWLGETLGPLFEQFSKTGELRLGTNFPLSQEMVKRVFYGLPGQAVFWNDRLNVNPLARDGFLLYPPLRKFLPSISTGFSETKREKGLLRIPLHLKGELVLDEKRRRVRVSHEDLKVEFDSSQIRDLNTFEIVREGEEKTHHYYTIVFSDGIRNYILEQRGKSYHASCYSDSNTDSQVSSGYHRTLRFLRSMT